MLNPNAFDIAPNVPTYFLVTVCPNPNLSIAFSANLFTSVFKFPNVTSTTFWTSAKSEPRLIHSFPKLTIALTEKAAKANFPIFFNEFSIPELLIVLVALFNPLLHGFEFNNNSKFNAYFIFSSNNNCL